MLHGESLQALRDEEQFSDLHRRELKRLTRVTLDRHLEGRPLHSRGLFSRLFLSGKRANRLGEKPGCRAERVLMRYNFAGEKHGTRRQH